MQDKNPSPTVQDEQRAPQPQQRNPDTPEEQQDPNVRSGSSL